MLSRAKQIDYIYDTLDDFLLASDFASANDFIQKFLDQTLPIELEYGLAQYLSVLTISRPWREKLKDSPRKMVLDKTKEMYMAKYGEDYYIAHLGWYIDVCMIYLKPAIERMIEKGNIQYVINRATQAIMAEEDANFIKMIDDIVKKENMEVDLDLSRKIQNEILYKYNHSLKDMNIVITKERKVGATTFTLKCLDELSRIGYKCLFVCPNYCDVELTNQNYHKTFKKTCSVKITYLENIKDRQVLSTEYNVVCFDEATLMNKESLNNILKTVNGFKIFTIQNDDDRVKDICFSGQYVGFKVSNPIEFQDPVDFKFQQEDKKETDYIPTALDNNIDYLISLLKERLNDNYYIKTADNGFVKSQVFTDKQFRTFLYQSLSSFNQTPTFTNYNFTDCTFVRIFADILVQGALVQCLGFQAVRERAHEFTTVNNGVMNSCPDVSTMLFDQYAIESNSYYNKLSDIKQGLVVDGKLAGLKGF